MELSTVFDAAQSVVTLAAFFMLGLVVGIFAASKTIRRLDKQVDDLTVQLRLKCSEIIQFSEAVFRLSNQLNVVDEGSSVKVAALQEVRDRLDAIHRHMAGGCLKCTPDKERDI